MRPDEILPFALKDAWEGDSGFRTRDDHGIDNGLSVTALARP